MKQKRVYVLPESVPQLNNSQLQVDILLELQQQYDQKTLSYKQVEKNNSHNQNNSNIVKVISDPIDKSEESSNEDLETQEISMLIDLEFIKFRWDQFLEFFIYHLLYLGLLGPLILAIFYLKPGKTIIYNMQFIGPLKQISVQLFMFLLNLTIFTSYFSFNLKQMYLYGEIIQLIISLVLRQEIMNSLKKNWIKEKIIELCSLIAIKYATYDPHMINYLKKNKITKEELNSRLYLGEWRQQTNKIILDEVQSSLDRNFLEENQFYMQFFRLNNPKFEQKLELNRQSLEESRLLLKKGYQLTSIFYKTFGTNLKKKIFSGFVLIKELSENFEKENKLLIRIIFILGPTYALARQSISIIMRSYDDRPALGDSGLEGLIIILTALNCFLLFLPSLLLLLWGIWDLKRINYCQTQLTYMLSSIRYEEQDFAPIFPTINFICPISLKGWFQLRVVVQDYGKQYMIRTYSMIILLVLIISIMFIFLLLSIMNWVTVRDPAFTVQIFADIFVVGGIFLTILYQGALINLKYDEHIKGLRSNRAALKDLFNHSKLIMDGNYESKNIVIQMMAADFKMYYSHLGSQEIRKTLKRIIQQYDDIIDQIKVDEEIKPFSIFGVKITLPLVKSLIVGLSSLAGTIASVIATLYITQK